MRYPVSLLAACFLTFVPLTGATFRDSLAVLTDPYLQLPTEDSVVVAWMTEGAGDNHWVRVGAGTIQDFPATSTRMTRLFEDNQSNWTGKPTSGLLEREIWRHEAVVTGLSAGTRVPYQAVSVIDGETFESEVFSLQPLPAAGQGTKLVLTSDQQNRLMSAASFQKLLETVPDIDGVLFAGDFVDVPHRASEWFDRESNTRPAFFPSLQGFYQTMRQDRWGLDTSENPYQGGQLLQNAWLFGTIGNHEAPGRWLGGNLPLNTSDNDPRPRWYAEIRYEQQAATINPTNDPQIRADWIRDNSFDLIQYKEFWNHPETSPGGETYYAYQIGDVFLISLHVNRVFRNWSQFRTQGGVTRSLKGKLTEDFDTITSLNPNTDGWGFGDMFFERFAVGTDQYNWLVNILASPEFQNAKYKVVIGHQTGFGLGDNASPVMAEPTARLTYALDGDPFNFAPANQETIEVQYPLTRAEWESTVEPLIGSLLKVTYHYPREEDAWQRDIEPLLLDNGVQLMLFGHSHLWNRTRVGGLNYLETSNYGDTFGVNYDDRAAIDPVVRGGRPAVEPDYLDPLGSFPDEADRWNLANYPRFNDPQGREPIFPTVANPEFVLGEESVPVPYVASNPFGGDTPTKIGVFTVLDTGTGLVQSWAFDFTDPASVPFLFDEFSLLGEDDRIEILTTSIVGSEFCVTYRRAAGTSVVYEASGTAEANSWSELTLGPDITETAPVDVGNGREEVSACLPLTGDRRFLRISGN